MIVALRLKQSNVSEGFVSVTYLGEIVEKPTSANGNKWLLKEVVVQSEQLVQKINNQTKEPFIGIQENCFASSVVTNQPLTMSDTDILWWRVCPEGDEVLISRNEAILNYRLQRAKLEKSGVIPSSVLNINQPQGRA